MSTIVAAAALPVLRSVGGRATAKELADALAQPRGHVERALRFLHANGYVEPDGTHYRLTVKATEALAANDAKIAAHAGEEEA